MAKAIRITKDNKSGLEGQYNMDEGFLEFSSGLYLIAQFGDSTYDSILTPTAYKSTYTETGTKLDNGYVEVVRNGVLAV